MSPVIFPNMMALTPLLILMMANNKKIFMVNPSRVGRPSVTIRIDNIKLVIKPEINSNIGDKWLDFLSNEYTGSPNKNTNKYVIGIPTAKIMNPNPNESKTALLTRRLLLA